MYFETQHKVAGQPWSFCGAMIYALESLHQHVTFSLCIIPLPCHILPQNYSSIPFYTLKKCCKLFVVMMRHAEILLHTAMMDTKSDQLSS